VMTEVLLRDPASKPVFVADNQPGPPTMAEIGGGR
jgi:hypothetical protein